MRNKLNAIPRFCAVLLSTVLLVPAFSGCAVIKLLKQGTSMPFNGTVSFHDITVDIPESYIRDSTSSDEDHWVFESGWYSKLIILSRSVAGSDPMSGLADYEAYLTEMGFECEEGYLADCPALRSSGTLEDGKLQREMLFFYNGYFYAVALRDGTEDEFWDLVDSIGGPESSAETPDAVSGSDAA